MSLYRIALVPLVLALLPSSAGALWLPHDQEVGFYWSGSGAYNQEILGETVDSDRILSFEWLVRTPGFPPTPLGSTYLGVGFTHSSASEGPQGSFGLIQGNEAVEVGDDWRLQPAYYSVTAIFKFVRPMLTDYAEVNAQAEVGVGRGTAFQNHGNGQDEFPFFHETYFAGGDILWRVGAGLTFTIPFLDTASYPDFPLFIGVRHTRFHPGDISNDPGGVVDDEVDSLDFTGTAWNFGVGIRF